MDSKEIAQLAADLIEMDKAKRGPYMQALLDGLPSDPERFRALGQLVGALAGAIDKLTESMAFEMLATEIVEDIERDTND